MLPPGGRNWQLLYSNWNGIVIVCLNHFLFKVYFTCTILKCNFVARFETPLTKHLPVLWYVYTSCLPKNAMGCRVRLWNRTCKCIFTDWQRDHEFERDDVGCHDGQHNDINLNDTQHKSTKHSDIIIILLSIRTLRILILGIMTTCIMLYYCE